MTDSTVFNSVLFSVENLVMADKNERLDRGNHRLCIPSLQIMPGQFITIVGPNGAGKSSFLHCLAGGSDFSGVVYFQQADVIQARHQITEQLVASLAVLPQHNQVEFNYSVDEVLNIGFSSTALGKKARDFIRRIACDITKVSEFIDKPVLWLSGGQQQRVHLARVIMQVLPRLCCVSLSGVVQLAGDLGVPDLGITSRDFFAIESTDFPLPCLLLDEPCASLDLEFQQRLQHYLKQLCALGMTVILVTHDLNSALFYSDQILLMDVGKMVACDHPEAVLTSENMERVFHVKAELTDYNDRRWLIVNA